jgi:hypothetical protein
LTSARETLPRPVSWPSSQSIVYARGKALLLSRPDRCLRHMLSDPCIAVMIVKTTGWCGESVPAIP